MPIWLWAVDGADQLDSGTPETAGSRWDWLVQSGRVPGVQPWKHRSSATVLDGHSSVMSNQSC